MRHMAQSYGEYRREGDIALGSRVVSQGLMEIGERIRKRRQELRWSQEYFAEKAGISVNTVIRIEGGQSATSIEVFEKIAEALKTDVNTLLGKTRRYRRKKNSFIIWLAVYVGWIKTDRRS